MGLTTDLKRTSAFIWTHKSALQEVHQRDGKSGFDASQQTVVRSSLCMSMLGVSQITEWWQCETEKKKCQKRKI